MPNKTRQPSRRGFLGLVGGGLALAASPARALEPVAAQALVQESLDEVYAVINSDLPAAQIYKDFEAIFARYADVEIIARSALGPAARQADAAQFAAYRQAFQGYIGRKYGKRFREFIGSKIEVTGARPVKSFIAVDTVAYLKGRSPMEMEWHVSDKSGEGRYFNIIIEGVNMLASERAEIGAMLALRKGDIAGLAEDLERAG
ncbi:MAG: ABC transporter substrate-binding protein [Paracoccus sp. (in: a-proteobacteria)]|uniref:MlaC/ttg2D family ABC transporter substrate-binding protein n=1 Tax=Paracoccus sp. TaxID=267 RepID=UPI0039E3ADE6